MKLEGHASQGSQASLAGDTEPDEDNTPPSKQKQENVAYSWRKKELMDAVSSWLADIGLSMYEKAFRQHGFDDLVVIEELNDQV